MSLLNILLITGTHFAVAGRPCFSEEVYKYKGESPLFKSKDESKEYTGCKQRIGAMTIFYTAKEVDSISCPKVCTNALKNKQSASAHTETPKAGH